jgi:hypothetical protein
MTRNRKTQTAQLWHDLVESAFDFFEKAIAEYDTFPKYAVLHLAASVELFLKSRLMVEHWSLIFDSDSRPNFDKLCNGDFESVTVNDAIAKLNGILPSKLHVSVEASKEFASLAKERNKIAHFLHSKLNNKKLQGMIVSQQCRVWYYIHALIADVWKEEYKDFKKQYAELSEKMRGQRKFLEETFAIVKPELDTLKKRPTVEIYECPACEFQSLVVEEDENIFHYARCKVCNRINRVLKIICPECDSSVLLECGDERCGGYDNDERDRCTHQFDPDGLAELLDLSSYSPDGTYGRDVFCPYCETGSVYESDGGYVCLSCFEVFASIDACDWCNEYWAGELPENSNYFGCGNCEGYAGHMKDD